jgi:hypothetical protein
MERFDRNPSLNFVHRFSRTRLVSCAAIILTLSGMLLAWLLPSLPAIRGLGRNTRLTQQVKVSRRSRSPFRPGLTAPGLGGLLRRSSADLADQPALADDLDREKGLAALGLVAPHLLDRSAGAPVGLSLPIASYFSRLASPLRC